MAIIVEALSDNRARTAQAFAFTGLGGYLTGTDVLCDGGIVGAGINPLTAARSRAA